MLFWIYMFLTYLFLFFLHTVDNQYLKILNIALVLYFFAETWEEKDRYNKKEKT